MEIKTFNVSHYPDLCVWWAEQKWPPIGYDMLPKTGFVIENTCAGFIYKTDSNLCLIEWIIANPKMSKEQRNIGLDILIDKLLSTSKELGFTLAFSFVKHPKLIERYKSHEFQITDQTMTHMMKVL